jgi:hypothetical protein
MKIEYDREVDALYVRLQEKFVAKKDSKSNSGR